MISVYFGSVWIYIGSLKAAQLIHDEMTVNIFRWPMAMFDTTPVGRIIARFASDVQILDHSLPFNLRHWIPRVFRVLQFFRKPSRFSFFWVSSVFIFIFLIILLIVFLLFLKSRFQSLAVLTNEIASKSNHCLWLLTMHAISCS